MPDSLKTGEVDTSTPINRFAIGDRVQIQTGLFRGVVARIAEMNESGALLRPDGGDSGLLFELPTQQLATACLASNV